MGPEGDAAEPASDAAADTDSDAAPDTVQGPEKLGGVLAATASVDAKTTQEAAPEDERRMGVRTIETVRGL